MRTALLLIALGCTALVGCHAEVKTRADFSASSKGNAEHQDDANESSAAWESSPEIQTASAPVAKAAPARAAFIGVTPDLTLAPDSNRTPACMCLAVAHGEPGSSKFQWQGGVPEATETSIALAISGDGLACNFDNKGAEPAIPSIAAVERSGDDVVVTIEPAKAGRPVMRGAMILKPGPKGALVIKGQGRVPFGKPADGSNGACRIPVK